MLIEFLISQIFCNFIYASYAVTASRRRAFALEMFTNFCSRLAPPPSDPVTQDHSVDPIAWLDLLELPTVGALELDL